MEDYALDVMIGKGPSARSLRLSLKPFTVVGATTRAGRISGPLRDRFGATYRLDFYTDDELAAIVDRSAAILGVEIEPAATRAIARRGRGTPRIVNRLLKRVRDHAEVHGDGRVDEATAREAMRAMEIDDEGLDSTDRKLLAAIVQKFASGPVGVAALAAVLSEEIETIEDVYEPFLLRLGFIDRTPQGRIATDLARAHLSGLGYEIPPPRRAEAGHAQPVGRPARRRSATGRRMTAAYQGKAARYEVAGPAAGRRGHAGTGREADADPRHGRDAAVHAGRDQRDGQGAHPGRDRARRARRSSSPTRTTCTCGPARTASRGSAACTGSWTGTARSSPTRAASRSSRSATCGSSTRTASRSARTSTARRTGSRRRSRSRPRRRSARTSRSPSTSRSIPTSPRAVVADATERTHRWAERSLAAHGREDQALFGIVQGGLDPELRAASTRFIASLPFDGICLGGLAGDETPAQRDATLDLAVPLLDDDPRPRYLMGLGSPADLLEAVHRGVDLFDSVLPARVARNGQLWVPGGRLNIRNRAFQDDPAPIQADCPCLACRRFSRAYLAHLFRAGELLAYRLATCHNLTFTLDFMARVRASIRAGTFPASMAELRSRAGRMSVDEGAGKSA